jgi:hypothetical protein
MVWQKLQNGLKGNFEFWIDGDDSIDGNRLE